MKLGKVTSSPQRLVGPFPLAILPSGTNRLSVFFVCFFLFLFSCALRLGGEVDLRALLFVFYFCTLPPPSFPTTPLLLEFSRMERSMVCFGMQRVAVLYRAPHGSAPKKTLQQHPKGSRAPTRSSRQDRVRESAHPNRLLC